MPLRVSLAVLLLLALVAPARGQVSGPPHIFSSGSTILAVEVNENFTDIYAAACARAGCSMAGNLLFESDNQYDIGATSGNRPRDLFVARNVAIGGTLTGLGVLTLTSTTAPQAIVRYDSSNRLEVSVSATGAVTMNAVGAGQAFTFSDTVTVPGFTSTSTGAISGAWTFTNTDGPRITSASARLWLSETDAGANSQNWRLDTEAGVLAMRAISDDGLSSSNVWYAGRSGTTVTSFTVATYLFPNTLTAATLGSPSNGAVVYCSDCTVANPCAGGGTGAIAKRLNGGWVCN